MDLTIRSRVSRKEIMTTEPDEVEETETDTQDETYLGTDPIYRSHAYSVDAPLSSGTAHETVAQEWEAGLAISSFDASVDQTAVSALHDSAGDVAPAIATGEDGVTVFTPPSVAATMKDVDDDEVNDEPDTVSVDEASGKELVDAAVEAELPTSGTKAEVAERLRAAGIIDVPRATD